MGALLPKPILSKAVERAGNYHVQSACASVNGFRVSMEDAHIMQAERDTSIFGVFDGHNGGECSEYIASHIGARLNALEGKFTPEALEKVCVDLDRDFAQDVGGASGSTATFCILTSDYKATIANVGDSRTLVSRDGKLLFATEDHKPSNQEERERIEANGGSVVTARVDGDLAVSRSFGDASFKRRDVGENYRNQKVIVVPDVREVQCKAGDIIIIACDGVFEGNFANEDVVKFVHEQAAKCADMAVVAARVCDEAIRRGSNDNISCMIVRLADGSSAVKAFGAVSFLPGPPFPRTHEASRVAYGAIAKMANVSTADALRMRYELIKAREKNALSSRTPLEQTAFEMSDEADIEAEKNFFGRGPAPGNEAAFFRSLAETGQ